MIQISKSPDWTRLVEKTWPCRSRRQLLRVLYGENHPAARRRGHAPLEGRSRVGVFGSANAATSAFISLYYLLWIIIMCAIIQLYPNEILLFKERVERCGSHWIPGLAPASAATSFFCFALFSLSLHLFCLLPSGCLFSIFSFGWVYLRLLCSFFFVFVFVFLCFALFSCRGSLTLGLR